MSGIEINAPSVEPRQHEVLGDSALSFVADLQRRFGSRRDELLAARAARRASISSSGRLAFLDETREIREADWSVAAAPEALIDRRVEITGPTDPKMAINALNSGARVWLADIEDANTPHWRNVVEAQVSLFDAHRGQLEFTSPEGKHYVLNEAPLAVPVVRPRGWHFDEKHVLVDGRPMVAALLDWGLHFFHNAAELIDRGRGPYYYLPKMESHLEARLWNDVFVHAQDALGVPHGSVRATVLIETIPAAFEMDEILFELRDHVSGLNAGRWDYLFSIIKCFRDAGDAFVLPDRAAVTMTAPFMRAYSELLVQTCHRRGAFAMGGMAAFIPSRRDPEVNAIALDKVRADKRREATDGYDGSWVAHPDLVDICREEFDAVLGDRPNQLDRQRPDVAVSGPELIDLTTTGGDVTDAGVRANVSVAIRYLASWLDGVGAAAIDNLMEDAATAEISRSQLWQWTHSGTVTKEGTKVSREHVSWVVDEVCMSLRDATTDEAIRDQIGRAREVFIQVALDDDFADFLTLPAYERYVA